MPKIITVKLIVADDFVSETAFPDLLDLFEAVGQDYDLSSVEVDDVIYENQ